MGIAGAIIVKNIADRAVPDYSKVFSIEGLTDSVRVYRDSFAIPHIYAQNQADLYRVAGYLTAQDRLWQMDLLRHVTTGRLSEIFGEDLLEADILMRSLRIQEKSEGIYEQTPPELKTLFEAYSNGINQFMENNKSKLPPEFKILGYEPEPWKPVHSFNLIGYIAWDLNGSWNSEIVLHKLKNKLGEAKMAELVPSFDSTQSVIYSSSREKRDNSNWGAEFILANQQMQELGLSVFHGSNNWAVSSAHSQSGKPLLANDMHLGLNAPGIWYPMHQVVNGELNVTGVVLPGAPFIISGHNQKIAWGLTNVMNDDIDFYKEELNPSNSNQYAFNSQWKNLEVRKEKIAVKGKDTITKIIKFTHRGPIISSLKGISDETISMRWLGNEWSNEVRTVYLLNRAGNWDDFKNAVKSFIAVSQNIVYADTAGNIGMYCSAGVPKRKGPAYDILPGNTDEYDWKGLVPFDSLPHYFNPESGIAISANNKTAPIDYPYYISYWYDLPFRYNRISTLLNAKEKHSLESFREIQTDFHSTNVEYYLPVLLSILGKANFSGSEQTAFNLLKKWDGNMAADKAVPTIYETFFMKFVMNVFQDEMGDTIYREFLGDKILVRNAVHRIWKTRNSAYCNNIFTKNKIEGFDNMVISSFKMAVNELGENYGNSIEKWEWGKLHTVSINHPLGKVWVLNKLFNLNRGPYSIGGSFHTIEPYSYKYTMPFVSTHGASQRHIYSLGNWDNSLVVIPTGISGVPASDYYCDQTSMYINKKYRNDWFSREKVAQHAKYTIVLKP
jgi:penicillin amidase